MLHKSQVEKRNRGFRSGSSCDEPNRRNYFGGICSLMRTFGFAVPCAPPIKASGGLESPWIFLGEAASKGHNVLGAA